MVLYNIHLSGYFSDKLPPPPPYPGTSVSVEATTPKLSITQTTGKVSLINVGIAPTNTSSAASVITSSFIADRGNHSAKDVIQGLSSRKMVLNNNASFDRKDGGRKLSSGEHTDEDIMGGVTTAYQTVDGAKSIIINASDAIMHTNNNKISIGSSINGVKYLLPLSPIQLSSSGKLEKSV